MEKYEQLISKFNMKILYFLFFFLGSLPPNFWKQIYQNDFLWESISNEIKIRIFFPLWKQVPYKGPTEIKPDMGRASVFYFYFSQFCDVTTQVYM
jgi:hypothetical protein